MEAEKINHVGVMDLLTRLVDHPETATGAYLYRGYRIQISRYGQTIGQRVLALYHRRRKAGQCVQCGEKVTKTNPRTGKPYRLCERHRKDIDGVKVVCKPN